MDHFPLIIGNLCSLLAMGTDSLSSTRKTAKGVLWVQCVSQLFYGFGAIMLKGYSGAVQNAVGLVRNLVAIKQIKSKPVEWLLVILGVALGVVFNNRGIMGWLPIIANLQYTIAVFRFPDDERALKISFLIALVMYTLFSVVLYNFVGIATNTVIIITTAIALVKSPKKDKEEK
jgi:hypothetical protein